MSKLKGLPEEDMPIPQLLDIEQIDGGWIKKYLLKYRLPNGEPYAYESISRKSLEDYKAELLRTGTTADAICIVGITPQRELLMVKEFRYPVNAWVLAFPAGLLEPGEDMTIGVARELEEETGYLLSDVPNNVIALDQPGYSSTGMSEESVHIIFARVEPGGTRHPEPMEFIEPFLLPLDEVDDFLAENSLAIGTRAQLILELFTHRTYFEGLDI